ncbi:hypothetical protein B1757_02685 [Acidithiobacillus marinus]|uniref:Uncharacterized protein n=1 Tax=Acidithiobacillus marinus TaxID=187490 RepID=A0A2I1DP85_9PROT|nr:hypothetical protein [Acidithiobacillus marinus]PKY11714.1 hypothetical protein B1757_02685 [Acidithiobacillus marinus]
MQRIQLKAGLLTMAVLAAFALVIIVIAGCVAAVVWALIHFLGMGMGLQQSITALLMTVLVSPFVVFVGWSVFDLVRTLYLEMLYFLDTKRRTR